MAATIPTSRRLAEDLAHVARFGADGDGVTRFAWSDELMQASRWLVRRLEELGLEAGIDAAGNVVGKWHAPGRALVLGSHLDTVPHGGRYDGTLGVLGALEAIRLLRERGFQPSRPVWLVAFNDEEGARFDTAMLGSRAFCGDDLAALAGRRDRTGTTLAAAMQAQGFAVADLPSARAVDDVAGYLELHIEQGRVLEVRAPTSAPSAGSAASSGSRSGSTARRITPGRRRSSCAATRSSARHAPSPPCATSPPTAPGRS